MPVAKFPTDLSTFDQALNPSPAFTIPPLNPTAGLMKIVAYGAVDAAVAPNVPKEHSTIHAYSMEPAGGGWSYTLPNSCDLWKPCAVVLNLTEAITPETLRLTVFERRPTLTVRFGGHSLTQVTTQLLLLEEPVLESSQRVRLTIPWKRMMWPQMSQLMMAATYSVELAIDGELESAELLTIDYLLDSVPRQELANPDQEIVFAWGGCRAEFTSDQWTTINSNAVTDGFLFSYTDNAPGSAITGFTWQLNSHDYIAQNQTMFNMSVEKLADNLYFYRLSPEDSFDQKRLGTTLNCSRIDTMRWKFTFADGGSHALDLTVGGANLFRRDKDPWVLQMVCGMAYSLTGGLSTPGSISPPTLAAPPVPPTPLIVPETPPKPPSISHKEAIETVVKYLESKKTNETNVTNETNETNENNETNETEAPALQEPENPWYQVVDVTSIEM